MTSYLAARHQHAMMQPLHHHQQQQQQLHGFAPQAMQLPSSIFGHPNPLMHHPSPFTGGGPPQYLPQFNPAGFLSSHFASQQQQQQQVPPGGGGFLLPPLSFPPLSMSDDLGFSVPEESGGFYEEDE